MAVRIDLNASPPCIASRKGMSALGGFPDKEYDVVV